MAPRKEHDPLERIPSSSVVREKLEQYRRLVRQYEVLLRTSLEIEQAKTLNEGEAEQSCI